MTVAYRMAALCRRSLNLALAISLVAWAFECVGFAQSVCLPSPRLLTTFPMGAQAGTSVEIRVTGEFIEDAAELRFSNPRIHATQVLEADALNSSGRYKVLSLRM